MSYQTIKMGSLYVGGITPPTPATKTDIPIFQANGDEPFIGHTIKGKEITWIRPDGMDILIADRAILQGCPWSLLKTFGFVEGKLVNIDGQWFRCRLPKVGHPGEKNEWDAALDICGSNDKLWHWKNVYTMGQEEQRKPYSSSSLAMVRGCKRSPRDYRTISSTASFADDRILGFRPVLEITNAHTLPGSKPQGKIITLEGQRFCLTLPGGDEAYNDWDEAAKAYKNFQGKASPWGKAGSWTCEHRKAAPYQIVVRGALAEGQDKTKANISAMHWANPEQAKCGFVSPVGFRPMLIPVDKAGNIDPTVFSGIEDGTVLKMYSLLINGKPMRAAKCLTYEMGADLTLTDTYFDKGYLLSWIIFNGKALALRNLVKGIDWGDLERMGIVPKRS